MPLPTTSTRRLALLLGGLTMFGPFSIDTIFPAFSKIAHELHVNPKVVQQTVSVYMMAYAVMGLAHGALSDAFGRKKIIVISLVVFVIASVGCALSPNMTSLLLFRALQGFSAGAGMIVGRAVIRDLYDGPLAQKLMSQVSMVFGIAPAIAPVMGGWILKAGFEWSMIFWFLVFFGVLLLWLTAAWLPETHPVSERTPLSLKGLMRGYKRIGLNRRFQLLSVSTAMLSCGIFLYIAVAPAFVMDLLHKTEQGFAWLFFPTIAGITIGSWLSGRMAGRLAVAEQVRWGFLCCVVASIAAVIYALMASKFEVPWAIVPIFVMGIGMGVTFPILTLAVLDLFEHQRGLASSLQVFVQLASNAVLAGVIAPLIDHDPVMLGVVAGLLFAVAWMLWILDLRIVQRFPKKAVSSQSSEPSHGL